MNDWRELTTDPESGITTEMRIVDGQMVVRHRIPRTVIDDIQEENKRRRNDFEWSRKVLNQPYLPVASIPENLHYEAVKNSGFDEKVGLYDRKHYNKLITNNPDFENFRLTPGKV